MIDTNDTQSNNTNDIFSIPNIETLNNEDLKLIIEDIKEALIQN